MTNYYSIAADEKPNYAQQIAAYFTETATLLRWGYSPGDSPSTPIPGIAVARAGVERCESALAKLDARKGPRADAARAWLTATRDRCADALAVLAEVTSDAGGFPGGGFGALVAEYSRLSGAEAETQVALDTSTTQNVKAARDALDYAGAARREYIQTVLTPLRERMAWPNPPSAEPFTQAESDTLALDQAARSTDKPASALAVALAQGKAAKSETALLWVAFERASPKGDIYEWRAKMHAECGGAGAAKPAAYDALTRPFVEPARWSPGHPVFASSSSPHVRPVIDPMAIREFGS